MFLPKICPENQKLYFCKDSEKYVGFIEDKKFVNFICRYYLIIIFKNIFLFFNLNSKTFFKKENSEKVVSKIISELAHS